MGISRRELLGLAAVAAGGAAIWRMRMDGTETTASAPEIRPMPSANFPPVSAQAGHLYDSAGTILYSKQGDKLLTEWGSVRKILAAVVVLENKADVLDSEYVTILESDILTTGPEFRSGVADGEQITWRDVLKLLLVPSMSDVASAITRVLGEELRLAHGIGDTAQQAIGYWMADVAARAGARNVLTLTATSNHMGQVQGEILPQNMYASCHALAKCMQYVLTLPVLRDIIQSQSVSVEVGGSNPRTITHGTVDRMRDAWDAAGALTGYTLGGYIGGKTGDSTWGSQLFGCEMPSGIAVYGTLYKSTTRTLRAHDIVRTLMAAESQFPHLRAAEVAADPHAADVAFRILGASDDGPLARTVTNDGVTTEASDFGSSMVFAAGGLIVGGPPPVLGSDDFTLDLLLRGNGASQASTVVVAAHWRAVPGGRGWMVQLDGNEVQFLYAVDGNNPVTVAFPLDRGYLMNGAPTTVSVQRVGPDLAVFVHGIRSAVHNIGSAAIFNPSVSPVTLGYRQGTGSGMERHYGGVIEEAALTLGVARYSMAGYRPRFRAARWD